MNTLNKDELQIIVNYLDHDTMRSLALLFLEDNPRQAFDIINCAMNELVEERQYMEGALSILSYRLEDIEDLSDKFHQEYASSEE